MTTSTLGLEGKVAAVTGASRGLGLAVARKLCAGGAHVHLNYAESDADARAAVQELASLPGGVTPVKADVADPDGFALLLDTVRERRGRLDVLVHNAAVFRPMSAVAADLAAFAAAQALALNPLLYGTAALTQLMPDGGKIVLISSNGAARVVPGYVGVGVAKAALESMARYLAVELAGRGIAVNVVSTSMLDKGADTADRQTAALLAARTPAGRLTRPADVADAVALLCAPEAHWIHGQVVTVDGALGLRA